MSPLLDVLGRRKHGSLAAKEFLNALGQSSEILWFKVQFSQIQKGSLPQPIGRSVGLDQLVLEVLGSGIRVCFSDTSNEHSVGKVA